MENGQTRRRFLGSLAAAATATERVARANEFPTAEGVLVVDGEAIHTPKDLHAYVALEASPGETLSVRVRRDGKVTSVPVEIGERPELVA